MLKPRYYQKNAVGKFFEYTAANHGKHPIVSMPTGTGKSLVQAHIVKKTIEYPDTRILLVTHQQELIKQNYGELIGNFDNDLFLDVGIYSAGLNRRDTGNRIIFAGIQSVYKKFEELGIFDLILVDECHLINHKATGMYRTFLQGCEAMNPKIVIGGLSATPFRMKGGFLHEGEETIFDDICYNVGVPELIDPNHFRNTDRKQYLCNIISKGALNDIDLSGVRTQAGEFLLSDQEKVFNTNDNISEAIQEILYYTKNNRKKILIFCIGINHCENIKQKFIAHDEYAETVHSRKTRKEIDSIIEDFRNNKIKYLINVDMLTTGFNDSSIDCIVMLRATKSPGLYCQIVGRGLRIHPDKENCLFLDYGQNILRHGPIDKIEIKKNKKGNFEIDSPPQKKCPECQTFNHAAVSHCIECGYEFPKNSTCDASASVLNVLSQYKKPVKYDVQSVKYCRHTKKGKPDSVKVDYHIGMFTYFSEWVCIEHDGFAGKKARQWLAKRTDLEIDTVDDFIYYRDKLKKPVKIIVNENGNYPQIISYVFEKEKTTDELLEQLI